MKREDVVVRFNRKIKKIQDTQCWEWQGYHEEKTGKPIISHKGINSYDAKRVAVLVAYGIELPKGIEIKRSCMNKTCVNTAHFVFRKLVEVSDHRYKCTREITSIKEIMKEVKGGK